MSVPGPELAVIRLPGDGRVPSWALELHDGFLVLVRADGVLTIVCPEAVVPGDEEHDPGWQAVRADAGGIAALARAGMRVIAAPGHAVVREEDLERALELVGEGGPPPDGPPPESVVAGRERVSSGSPFEPRIGFSRAIRAGRRVLVSGTGPVMRDGSCPEGTLEQARRCWDIVLEALATAGASADDVVRTRTYLTPAGDAEGAMAAHGEVFGDVRPASTMLVVHALLDSRWTVEVEADAELP